jgi:penicillin-binding protein 2
MNQGRIYEDLSFILRRAQKTVIIIGILFIFLFLFFWKVQVLDHQKYWQRSEANRIREVSLPPQRGLIKDRNGNILAKNVGSYTVSIIRENSRNLEETYPQIAELLNLDEEELRKRVDEYKSLPLFQPIVIKDELSIEEVSRIEARKFDMPELYIQAEPMREYPMLSSASHVLGYLQQISLAELKSEEYSHRRAGSLVGKTGIERQYEKELMGTEGKLTEIVDSLGRFQGEISRTPPINGKSVLLTLDMDLQLKAEEILEGREGAIVVMKPKTGEILAMASYPRFDPNKFISRFTPEEWTSLRDDPDSPLDNRAIRGLYAPGSVFKLTMGLAALQSRVITASTTHLCTGSVIIYNRPQSCWYQPGHGNVNLVSAIQHSCNIFFYQIGKQMDIDIIANYADMLGFGRLTGIDLPGEKEGLFPNRKWKEEARGEPWYPGETINISIGQGQIQVTPLQIAVFTAIIANRGGKVEPFLVSRSGDESDMNRTSADILPQENVDIDPSYFEKVIRGAWLAVNEGGTAAGARVPGFDVCGKTGSTQLISRELAKILAQRNIETKTHSWFTGFAPQRDPQVVVTILIEYGGGGGETAAPLSRQLFELYREIYD